jgi:vitamin B12 transporter
LSQTSRVDVRLGRESAQVDYDEDNFGFGLVTDTYRMDRVTSRAQVSLMSQVTPDWRTQLSLAGNRQDIEDRKNGVLRTSAYSYGLAQSRHTGMRWDNLFAYSDSGHVVGGLDHAIESYESDASQAGYRTERTMSALYVGLNQQMGAWTLQANARRDSVRMHNQLTDARKRWGETSALIGAAYDLESGWRVSANVAQGFRVPTSSDMSRSPDLRPEHYLNRELGVSYRQGGLQTRLAAFWTQAADMIILHPSTFQMTNTNAKNRGLEWSGSYLWGQTQLNGSITLQNPRNLDTGLAMARRGKKLATVGVSHPMGDWSVGDQARYQSQRRDQDFSNRVLESYAVLDMLVAYRIAPSWKLHMKLENAGNRDYQLAYGYNTPRRAVWLMLDYTSR